MEHYWRQLVEGKRSGLSDRLLLTLLAPVGALYGAILALRALFYRLGIKRTERLPKPVISVGNLAVGGTGKTPLTLWLAQWYIARGKRVVVLSRGYGGSREGETAIVADGRQILLSAAEAGDEPVLLARAVPGLMVVIGRDRAVAGRLAMAQLQPDIFLLDDGYQHLRLARDLNILVLDATRPFGNGRPLPAGGLREWPTAARRADLVVLTRDSATAVSTDDLPALPVVRTRHQLISLTRLGAETTAPLASLLDTRLLAFAGIADPAAFFAALTAAGLTLAAEYALADHQVYTEQLIDELCRERDRVGATCLVTTAKDAVKLLPWAERLGRVEVANLTLEMQNPEQLTAQLQRFI